MQEAESSCHYIITFRNLQKIQNAPCPSCLSQMSIIVFKPHARCRPTQIPWAEPLHGLFRGGHVFRAHTSLTSKRAWVCDISMAGSVQGTAIQLQRLIPVMGATGSFLSEFWKKQNKPKQPSCNQKFLLSQPLAHLSFVSFNFILKFIFILVIHYGPDTKWFMLEHAAW